MEKFDIHILGCGSALPTIQHFPSCQVVDIRGKLFMVDCGEGAQLQFRKNKLRFGKLKRIFISHLHGDHCFGLPGFISSLSLLGRTEELIIHSPKDLESLLAPQLKYFCNDLSFQLKFEEFDTTKNEIIYEDRSVKISTIPLVHRVPCAGFLFEEQPKDRKLIREMTDFYKIPVKELAEIKKGKEFITEGGALIPNDQLTRPSRPSRKYAYCSDTSYSEKIIPVIEGIDLLYHESTFLNTEKKMAYITGHTTAEQAATLAKKANVRKLMLGHFSSRYPDNKLFLQEATPIFPETVLANENLCEKL